MQPSSFPFKELLCLDARFITIFSCISITFSICIYYCVIFRVCSTKFKQLHSNTTRKRFKSIQGNEVNETLLVKYYDIQKKVVAEFVDDNNLVELIFSFLDCTPDHQEKHLLTHLSRQYHYPFIKSIAISSIIYSSFIIISQISILSLIIIDYIKWYSIEIKNSSTLDHWHYYIGFGNCLLILQPQLRIFKLIIVYLQDKYPILPCICRYRKFIAILLYSGFTKTNWNNKKRFSLERILKGQWIIQISIVGVIFAVSAPFLILAVLVLFFLYGTIFCLRPLFEILLVLLRRINKRLCWFVIKVSMIFLMGYTNQIIWSSVRNTSENWYSTKIVVDTCNQYTQYGLNIWEYIDWKSIIIILSWIML